MVSGLKGRLKEGSLDPKMAIEQTMKQAIIQAPIKATKGAIMTVREADYLVNNARPVNTMPRSGG